MVSAIRYFVELDSVAMDERVFVDWAIDVSHAQQEALFSDNAHGISMIG